MSVQVNLLPEATKQRGRASQQRAVAGLVGVALLVGLGGVYWWASSQVSQAEEELLAEQARTSALTSEKGELVAFQELADRRDSSDQILRAAMAGEVSFAGVLQDLASVMPTDTQLETLAITVVGPQAPADAAAGVGTFNITGKTLTSHAPGVERVLLSLDKVVSFRGLYLNSSTLDDQDERVATFSLDGQIGDEAATQRYANGIPEDLR